MQKKLISEAVESLPPGASAIEQQVSTHPRILDDARKTVAHRRLTVDIRVVGEAADDSALAPLVAESLVEFLEKGHCGKISGTFESRAGLDVHWRAVNEYFDRAGFRVHVDGDKGRHPVPIGVAHINADGSALTIRGVNFSMPIFEILAKPDPAKRYSFAREGDTVVIKEV